MFDCTGVFRKKESIQQMFLSVSKLAPYIYNFLLLAVTTD